MAEGNHILYPMSQEECAALANYQFIATNLITNDALQEQQAYIEANYHLVAGNPPLCACGADNEEFKCGDERCINWRKRLACPVGCGHPCRNNPFENPTHTWAAGVKTCIQGIPHPDNDFAVFATAQISERENVDEFRGLVRRQQDGGDDVGFCINLRGVNQIIDARGFGTVSRMINHSVHPNLEARIVIHDSTIKIILYAIRNINPGEELTVDWSRDPA